MGLPVKLGGLGIPQASHLAVSAFCGSFFDTVGLQLDLLGSDELDNVNSYGDNLVELWTKFHGEGQDLNCLKSEIISHSSRQSFLTDLVHSRTLKHLRHNGDGQFLATVSAVTASDSGIWTLVLPKHHPNTIMDSLSYSSCIKFRYGLAILDKPIPCENCSDTVDVYGHHLDTCSGAHHRHHDAIRDLLHSEARRAQLPASREPKNLLESDEFNQQRPADVYIPSFTGPRDACIDVSIVSSFTHLDKAIKEPGFNAARAAGLKMSKYKSSCNQANLNFMPFVLESVGGFDAGCDKILKAIGRALGDIDRMDYGTATHLLKRRISFKWQWELGNSLASQIRTASRRHISPSI
jgi:hypothetical protein